MTHTPSRPVATEDTGPVADRGEGTVAALVAAAGGTSHRVEVTGPESTPVTAEYGMLSEAVVIEMASAAGLPLTTTPQPRTDHNLRGR